MSVRLSVAHNACVVHGTLVSPFEDIPQRTATSLKFFFFLQAITMNLTDLFWDRACSAFLAHVAWYAHSAVFRSLCTICTMRQILRLLLLSLFYSTTIKFLLAKKKTKTFDIWCLCVCRAMMCACSFVWLLICWPHKTMYGYILMNVGMQASGMR